MLYLACGCVIDSNMPLPGVGRSLPLAPDVAFRLSRRSAPSLGRGVTVHRWTVNRASWLKVERFGTNYSLQFRNLATFHLLGRSRIECYANPATPLRTIAHLFLNQTLPLALSARGMFVLHSSATNIAGRAAAFIGRSGKGKSTLAGSFMGAGFPVLTDDCLVVDAAGKSVLPGYPSVRLWPESLNVLKSRGQSVVRDAHYTEKRLLVKRDGFDHSPVKIARLYLLDSRRRARVRIEPLTPPQAFLAFVKHSYILDPTDPACLESQFRGASRLAQRPIAFRLGYPRDFAELAQVRQEVIAHTAGRPLR
jgi:hypothetical protein